MLVKITYNRIWIVKWLLTCGHLVAEASTAAVDHHTDLPLVIDAHLLGSVIVVDLIHHLNLSVVVSCTQRPQLHNSRRTWRDRRESAVLCMMLCCKCVYLRQSSLLGFGRDFVGIGLQHPAVFLTVLLILGPSVSFPQRPVHTHL